MTHVDLILQGYRSWNDASILNEVGAELEDRARFEPARIFLERCIELAPHEHGVAYIHLAYSHFRDSTSPGAMERGMAILRRGLQQTDSDHLASVLATWLSSEEEEEAQQLLSRAAARCNDADILTISSIRMWRGGAAEAVAALGNIDDTVRRVLGSDDGCLMADVGHMLYHLSTEGLIPFEERSIDVLLDSGMSTYPDVFDVFRTATSVYRSQNKWEEVGAVCRRGLVEIPDEETLMMNLAIANTKLGDFGHAEKWFLRAIGAKPSFAGARIGLAQLYDSLGRADEAVETAREVISANPAYLFGYAQVAAILDKNGLSSEGVELLRSVRESLAPWMIRSIERDEAMRTVWNKLNEH